MIAPPQTIYELWDLATGNLIGDYNGEAAALLEVKEGVQVDGTELWSSVALARVEPGGVRVPIAQGDELLILANSTATETEDHDNSAIEIAQAAHVLAAIRALDTITDSDLDAATGAIQAAIASSTITDEREAHRYQEAARAILAALSASTGVSIHVEPNTDVVTFSTPDETVAGLLAARLSRRPRQVYIRVINSVYQIAFATPESNVDQQIAS